MSIEAWGRLVEQAEEQSTERIDLNAPEVSSVTRFVANALREAVSNGKPLGESALAELVTEVDSPSDGITHYYDVASELQVPLAEALAYLAELRRINEGLPEAVIPEVSIADRDGEGLALTDTRKLGHAALHFALERAPRGEQGLVELATHIGIEPVTPQTTV